MCFVNSNENLLYTLGLLNSTVAKKFLEVLAPTLDFHEGPVSRLPIIIDDTVKGEVEDLVKKNILISKMDWNSNENSWEYKCHPLLKNKGKIIDNFTKWKEQVDSNFEELKSNEEKLNNIFVRVFDLKDEVKYTIEDSDLTIGRASVEQDIRSLISYAVGCMFGRYSLDTEGITYAGGEWNLSNYSSFIPDRDGIILISDMKFFNDDIVARFEEFIRIAYGDVYLEENLDFISRVLGNKGTSSRDIIRNYFVNDFFKEHCNSYSLSGAGKRPIYWLFDSGKENGFKCLIYMHRYTKDTLNLIRSEYLRKTEDAIESALKNSEYVIQTSSSAVEKAKATKDRDKFVKQLNEMRIYYQALSHLAIQKIEIDLDNGVKNNYQLFQGIEVIVDGGKKQKVDLLAKI